MPSTKTNSEPDPATNNDDSNLSTHKRLDSRDLEGVGAQFRRASKADSIARPADLDLDSDEEEFQVHQHSTGDQADGTQRARSEGGSSSAARVGHHQYSKEDVALLIFHRDKGHNAEGQGGTSSHIILGPIYLLASLIQHSYSQRDFPSFNTRCFTEND
jgi:hypothetical protein